MGVTKMKRAAFLMVPALLLSMFGSASAGGGHKHGFVGVSGFGVAPVGFVSGGFAPVGYSSVGFSPVGFAPVGYVGAPMGVNPGVNAQGVLDQLIFEILRRGINNRMPDRGVDANPEARLARIEARL